MIDKRTAQMIDIIIPNLQGRTVAIWGMNEKTKMTQEKLRRENIPSILLSTNFEKWVAQGVEVHSPKELDRKKDEYFVFINTGKYHPEMELELNKMGYKEETDYIVRTPRFLGSFFCPNPEGYTDIRGNQIIGDLHTIQVRMLGSNSCIEVAEGFAASGLTVTVYSNVKVKIGKGVRVGRGRWSFYDGAECIIGDNCDLVTDSEIFMYYNSHLEIGCNSRLGESNKLLLNRETTVLIGREALFARRVTVLPADGHPIYDLESGQQLPVKTNIIIRNHVWIGLDTLILGNTEIGTGCIVGAQSLVKGYFPNNCMIAGTVARVVRKNIAWSRMYLEHGLADLAEEYKQFTCEEEILK